MYASHEHKKYFMLSEREREKRKVSKIEREREELILSKKVEQFLVSVLCYASLSMMRFWEMIFLNILPHQIISRKQFDTFTIKISNFP